jgi:hypothetical protein
MRSGRELGNLWLHEHYSRFAPQPPRQDGARLRLCFLLGSTDIGGGTYVILQHALYAQRAGADVTLVPLLPRSGERTDWHPALSELRIREIEQIEGEYFDLAIATWWRTVFELPRIRSPRAAYFVQSEEARFTAAEEDPWAGPLAELTYAFDLPIITIASWLQAFLAFGHARPSFLAPNGIDKRRYGPLGPVLEERRRDHLRVLVEGPVDVPMKAVERSLEIARASKASEVWLLTSSHLTADVPGADRVFSRVPIDYTPSIYRSCDVLLKLSEVEGMYGPPLEMFHCGGTVVTNDVTGHDEYVSDGENALVVPMGDDQGAISALDRLAENPALLSALTTGALRTATTWPDWASSSRRFWLWLNVISQQEQPNKMQTMLAIKGAGADVR